MHMYFTRAVNHRQYHWHKEFKVYFKQMGTKSCLRWAECFCTFIIKAFFCLMIIYHLLTESEVITGKSQTEALMYGPSDSEVDTSRLRSEISL